MNVIERIRQFTATAPVNVEGLIESFGVELTRKADLNPDIAGQIECVEPGRFRISANAADHYYRRRFTMAHELGHFLLHRDLIGVGVDDNRAYRSTDKGAYHNKAITTPHEIEANQFAANLLMPQKLVRELWNEHAGNRHQIARRLQVSDEALGYRLQSLGLG